MNFFLSSQRRIKCLFLLVLVHFNASRGRQSTVTLPTISYLVFTYICIFEFEFICFIIDECSVKTAMYLRVISIHEKVF